MGYFWAELATAELGGTLGRTDRLSAKRVPCLRGGAVALGLWHLSLHVYPNPSGAATANGAAQDRSSQELDCSNSPWVHRPPKVGEVAPLHVEGANCPHGVN